MKKRFADVNNHYRVDADIFFGYDNKNAFQDRIRQPLSVQTPHSELRLVVPPSRDLRLDMYRKRNLISYADQLFSPTHNYPILEQH